jgi:GrpB-like predicted nucleotidyltransferase (UPF0157 family)
VWSEFFHLEAKRLREKLGQRIGQIEHVGSTAIPELIAKPIIDLMASVEDLEEASSLIPDIETLGYTYGEKDEISDRHYFKLRLQDGTTGIICPWPSRTHDSGQTIYCFVTNFLRIRSLERNT